MMEPVNFLFQGIFRYLFEKTNNLQQMYKKTSSTFYTSTEVALQNNVLRRKNLQDLITDVSLSVEARPLRVVRFVLSFAKISSQFCKNAFMKFKKNFFTKLIFLLKNQAGFFKPSSENKYLLFLFHHLERKYIYVECLTDVSRN